MERTLKDIVYTYIVVFILGFIGFFTISYMLNTQYQIKISSEQTVENRLNNLQKQIETYAKKETINDAKRQIDILNNRIEVKKIEVASISRDLAIETITNVKIENLPTRIIVHKRGIEIKLQEVNVMIHNVSEYTLGSGVTIKYNDKFYILSAGHMAETENDKLELWENGQKICDLKIVKHEHALNDIFVTEEESLNSQDLILLQPIDENIVPIIYTELADYEPIVGEDIYIVGNPMGKEDVITDGRIIKFVGNFMEYVDHTYFGNSGGGVYNKEGKLLGIVSHLEPLQPIPTIPAYMVYRAVRLDTIKKFLKDLDWTESIAKIATEILEEFQKIKTR